MGKDTRASPDSSSHVEPWHRGTSASGMVRDMVYGFNDGLTANFGLVMGVVSAAVSSPPILLTSFASLIADALSMAAHFLVGTGRAILTGRPAVHSGFEMFAIGMEVAVITYLIGLLVRIKF